MESDDDAVAGSLVGGVDGVDEPNVVDASCCLKWRRCQYCSLPKTLPVVTLSFKKSVKIITIVVKDLDLYIKNL